MNNLKVTAIAAAAAMLAPSVVLAVDYITLPTVYIIGHLEPGDLVSSNNGTSWAPGANPSYRIDLSPPAWYSQYLNATVPSPANPGPVITWDQIAPVQLNTLTPGLVFYAAPAGAVAPAPQPAPPFFSVIAPPSVDGRPTVADCGLAQCAFESVPYTDDFGFVSGGSDVLVQKLTVEGPTPISFEFKSSDFSYYFTPPEMLQAATKASCLATVEQEKQIEDMHCSARSMQLTVVGTGAGGVVAGSIILAGVILKAPAIGMKLGTWAGGAVAAGGAGVAASYQGLCALGSTKMAISKRQVCGELP
jgi:hypothetical protein